ncbi:TonB-dependent receptor [Niabella soli]|nr:TonB-dependent receptor [Niabella soli]
MRVPALFLLIAMQTTAHAQRISGAVAGVDHTPLEKASVSLLQARDSATITTTATDKNGLFRFDKIKAGSYLILASSVGHTPVYSSVIKLDQSAITIDTLVLEKTTTQMKGVVVIAKRPPFEVKAGKTVVNVDASPSNAGLNVLELLEKSPGISVDNDGNVSLKGKAGVTILVDGKPTYMSGQQLTNFLKSMQSSQLDQIEIMTAPPAKYDAAGNSGVINIKTKKGTIKGMNGTANVGYDQGFYPRYNAGLNINYRNDKLNIFGGYEGGHWDNKGVLYLNRKFIDPAISTVTGTSDQASDRRNFGNYNNLKLGMDYNFTKKDVAGFVVNGGFGQWNEEQNSPSNIRYPDGAINYKLLSIGKNTGNFNNVTTNLNYKHSFDSTGKELSIDLDQAYYNNKGLATLQTKALDAQDVQNGNIVNLLGHQPSEINIYSFKTDYVHPFNKTTKLEAGIKTSFVNTNNRVEYQRDTSTGWYPDLARSNHFIYKENINAAYATISKSAKKWELTGGLRVENTSSKGDLITGDSVFTRNYTNLFPTVAIGFNANDKNQFNISYNRRITRPDYDNLNPFVYFLDSLTFGKGNPYLKPQFTNNIELSHTFKKFLTTTLNYTVTNDIITQLLKQEGDKTFQTNENFSKMRQLGIAVTANFPVTKWWNLNLYTNLYNNDFEGLYNDGRKNYPVRIQITSFTGNGTSTMTFAKLWAFELSGWYRSKATEGLMVSNSMGALNAALSYKVMKEKGTVKVGVRDIFKTQVFSGYARYAIVDTDLKNTRDSRQFNVSFTYKFGKNNIAPVRNRRGGAGDEQNRVKSGGN